MRGIKKVWLVYLIVIVSVFFNFAGCDSDTNKLEKVKNEIAQEKTEKDDTSAVVKTPEQEAYDKGYVDGLTMSTPDTGELTSTYKDYYIKGFQAGTLASAN
jgi:hypothetical protein